MASDENQEQNTGQSETKDGDIYAGGFYEYRDSHIRERHGYVPKWLWFVTAGLLVWSIYYLVIYWNAPHPILF
jgi:hypothetical protein